MRGSPLGGESQSKLERMHLAGDYHGDRFSASLAGIWYTVAMAETIFIAGREPELSAAELHFKGQNWGATALEIATFGTLLEHSQPLPENALNQLGGSIKQVDVLECVEHQSLVGALRSVCTAEWLEKFFPSNRIEFGVSGYGLGHQELILLRKHFLGLKKDLHEAGRPVRLVVSREPQLSAVTVQRNGLLKKGKEIIIYRTSKFLVIGITRAVQDYRAYSRRDFGRPTANAKSGMLPPKLAQIMLNLADVGADDILLDPFCGSGTVLQEAALLSVAKIFGSDQNPEAAKGAQNNIRWLLKEFPEIRSDIEITRADARETKIRPTVIVTEPYLGQPLRGHEPEGWLTKQKMELEKMYLQVFQHWKNYLNSGARVVMIWPEFVFDGGTVTINLDQAVKNLNFRSQELLPIKTAAMFGVDRYVLTYGRDEARVRRQIRMWLKA